MSFPRQTMHQLRKALLCLSWRQIIQSCRKLLPCKIVFLSLPRAEVLWPWNETKQACNNWCRRWLFRSDWLCAPRPTSETFSKTRKDERVAPYFSKQNGSFTRPSSRRSEIRWRWGPGIEATTGAAARWCNSGRASPNLESDLKLQSRASSCQVCEKIVSDFLLTFVHFLRNLPFDFKSVCFISWWGTTKHVETESAAGRTNFATVLTGVHPISDSSCTMALHALRRATLGVKQFPPVHHCYGFLDSLMTTRSVGQCYGRTYSSVKLSFSVEGTQHRSRAPLVVLHGVLGSKLNFRAISKALSARLNRPMYALDARNHGSSPWTDEMSYEAMSDDVCQFLRDQQLSSCYLIGHSMGGKTAMVTALRYPELVEKLIVVDSSPDNSPAAGNVSFYLDVLTSFELNTPDTADRKQVQALVEASIKEKEIRDFLLTNLLSGNDGLYWRANLKAIKQTLPRVFSFPELQTPYTGQTLFIGGKRSNYIRPQEHDRIRQFFPNAKIDMLDTGHWVHHDNPTAFMNNVASFVSDQWLKKKQKVSQQTFSIGILKFGVLSSVFRRFSHSSKQSGWHISHPIYRNTLFIFISCDEYLFSVNINSCTETES